MDIDTLRNIINAANKAPSGGNSQPWEFHINPDLSLEVTAHPDKDHPVLNFKNRGSYLAHGALMENIQVASEYFGYEPEFILFPRDNVSMKVLFKKGTVGSKAGLYESLHTRHTNRKPYSLDLKEGVIEEIFGEADSYPECKLYYVTGDKIRQVAEHLPFDMIVFLQNKLLHSLLFKEVLWEEEHQKTHSGLYVKTLEMFGPKAKVFKLLSNWKFAKLLNKLNFPKQVYQGAVKNASSAAVIGCIAVENQDYAFLHAGRLLENIWLHTERLGLHFQMMTGVVFLWQQLNYGKHEIFSQKEKDIINNAYENIAKVFGVSDKIIASTFRIGKGENALATSLKREPVIHTK
jgi:nitroreductase